MPLIPTSKFPSDEELSRAFVGEAVRHLIDAQLLIANSRYAAGVASSLKAIELAVKGLFLIDGAHGWWDKIFASHRPINEAINHAVLKSSIADIDRESRYLSERLRSHENLEPQMPGKGNFDPTNARNAEYPYFTHEYDPHHLHPDTIRIHHPSFHFQECKNVYNDAVDLLGAICKIRTELADLKKEIPSQLG